MRCSRCSPRPCAFGRCGRWRRRSSAPMRWPRSGHAPGNWARWRARSWCSTRRPWSRCGASRVEPSAGDMMSPKTMRDVFLVLGTIASCATVTPNYDYKQDPDPWKAEFVIGVGDGIRINVWKTPELSTDARVRPDGTITMPLLGDLLATNRTPTQLRDEITRRMKTFV